MTTWQAAKDRRKVMDAARIEKVVAEKNDARAVILSKRETLKAKIKMKHDRIHQQYESHSYAHKIVSRPPTLPLPLPTPPLDADHHIPSPTLSLSGDPTLGLRRPVFDLASPHPSVGGWSPHLVLVPPIREPHTLGLIRMHCISPPRRTSATHTDPHRRACRPRPTRTRPCTPRTRRRSRRSRPTPAPLWPSEPRVRV